jgi:hypothetical protein
MGTAIAALIGLADTAAARLAPGEEFIKVGDFQAIDFWKPRRAIKDVTAPGAAGPFGSRQIGAGITNRRLLLFALGGLAHAEVKGVLLEVPIADVEAITCESHWWKSFELRLAFGGVEYPFVIAHIGRGQKMARALETAHGAQA